MARRWPQQKVPVRQKVLNDKQVAHPYTGYYANLLGTWMQTRAHAPLAQPLDHSTTRAHKTSVMVCVWRKKTGGRHL